MAKFIIGITGASGSIYAHRLVMHLKDLGHEVHIVCTETGRKVCAYENAEFGFSLADKVYENRDLFAPVSSGSYLFDGMAVLPCSMGSLAKIAHGIGDNLLVRTADVCIKERRKLIIVPRECPMSSIHLENQKKLSDQGAVIIPASPAFYMRPKTIDDLVDSVLSRVLDHLGVTHRVGSRWRSPEPGEGIST